MRLLVLSDSHQRAFLLQAVLKKETDADVVFHLGDGAADLRTFMQNEKRPFYLLQGNCDSRFAKLEEYFDGTVAKTHIFAAHGDAYNVKFGLEKMALQAQLRQADLVLYGHTHIPFHAYDNGVHFFNPGALTDGRYGCVDITDSGIFCIHKEIK